MTDKVYVSALLTTVPGKEDLMREALKELVAAVRSEPGCTLYDLHESTSTPGNFMFYEIWDSEQDLEVHNNTELMKAFGDKAGGWLGSITVETYRRL